MKRTISILLFALCSVLCWGNGDPVMYSSALTLSRNPQGRHIPEIMLTSENLEITAQGPYSHIKVTYVLTNTSKKKFKNIAYGFPVDWYGGDKQKWGANDYYTESERLYGWSDEFVKDIHFSIDNKSLKWECSADTILTHAIAFEDKLTAEEKAFPKEERDSILECRWEEDGDVTSLYDLRRKWYYTTFNFAPNQQRTLTIEYTIANNYSNSLYGEEGFKNEDERIFDHTRGWGEVMYDLTPAAYWGNGKAGTICIIIDFQNYRNILESNNFVSYWKDKLQQITNSGRWIYKTTDFDFQSAEPLYCGYGLDNN